MKTKDLAISAILIAIGIVIPMIMPIKIMLPPASYTLAAHVPVFIAMFISPLVAILVSLGTAFGFLMTSTPEIAARALSHIVFATIGALYIRKHPEMKDNPKQLILFSVWISLIHVIAEMIVVTPFFISDPSKASQSYLIVVLGLVGVGGFVHSLVDFSIASFIRDRLSKI